MTTLSPLPARPLFEGVSRPKGPPPAWSGLPDKVTVEFKSPKPQPFRLDPATTALVIVDMQNAFVHSHEFPFTGRSSRGNPMSSDNMARLSSALAGNVKFLERARKAGIPIIYIQSVRNADNLEVTRFSRNPYLIDGTPEVEIVPELKPLPGEPVVKKLGHDPWARTNLEAVLEERGIVPENWTVIVTGVSAATCQEVCTIGFSNRHYMTLIPLDCTAGPSVESEARAFGGHTTTAYNHNVAFTMGDLITFEAGAPAAERQLVF